MEIDKHFVPKEEFAPVQRDVQYIKEKIDNQGQKMDRIYDVLIDFRGQEARKIRGR